jgi:sialidase-1
MKIKDPEYITIYQNPEHWEAHTCVCQLKNGEVLVSFNQTRKKMHEDFDTCKVIRSKDQGRTWDPSSVVTVWPQTETFGSDIPLITQISDGTVLVNHLVTSFFEQKGIKDDFGPQSEEYWRSIGAEGTWISRSNDNGHTWEPGYKVNQEPMRWIMPADSILELPNGTLLMAVLGQLNTRRERKDQEPIRAVCMRSDDKGFHWEHWSTIAFDAAGIISYDEPALGRAADGTLVCMMRTEHLPRERHQHMWVAYSKSDGEAWSRPELTNIWGYPADLITLKDGRMLAVYGYRRAPWGLRGCISEDGLHWDVKNEFVFGDGGFAPPTAGNNPFDIWWHIGYPHAVQLQNGRILAVDHNFTSKEPYMQQVVGVLFDI